MPIYEYRCESCGEELEKIQKISDPPLTECPACGKPALKKLVSASSFRLKGTGWYETDFKNKKKTSTGEKTGGNQNSDAGNKDSGSNDKADKPKAAVSEKKESGKSDTNK